MSDTVLVTGATGFVGSAVARALVMRGFHVRALMRAGANRLNIAHLNCEPVIGDMRDADSMLAAMKGARYLFHVAADYRLWVPDPDAMMRANVEGTRHLLLAAQAAGVERVVYCSSVAALGLIGDGSVADELTPVHVEKIVGVYKKSKYLAEQAVLALVRNEGVPAVIVNPSTPIGPRDIKPTPTGKMIRDATFGRMPAYVDTGLNVVHVDDVAEGHLLALDRGLEVGGADAGDRRPRDVDRERAELDHADGGRGVGLAQQVERLLRDAVAVQPGRGRVAGAGAQQDEAQGLARALRIVADGLPALGGHPALGDPLALADLLALTHRQLRSAGPASGTDPGRAGRRFCRRAAGGRGRRR